MNAPNEIQPVPPSSPSIGEPMRRCARPCGETQGKGYQEFLLPGERVIAGTIGGDRLCGGTHSIYPSKLRLRHFHVFHPQCGWQIRIVGGSSDPARLRLDKQEHRVAEFLIASSREVAVHGLCDA